MKISALLHNNNRILHSFLLASGIYGILAFSVFYMRENFIPKDVGLQNQHIAISLNQFIPDASQVQSLQPPLPQPKPIEKIKPLPKTIKPKHHRKETKMVQSTPKEFVEPQIQKVVTNPNLIPINTAPQMLTFGKNNDPLLLAIKQAIDKNLHYPRKARMMRAEGIVTVEFTLLSSGGIQNVKIIDSSGNPILDKSALRTIFDAKDSFPLVQNNMIIQIPIQYHLKS